MLTCTEPNVAPTGRYSTMETSRVLGIDRKTLQRYADKGYIRRRHRAKTFRPFYLGQDILSFWRAYA